MVEGGPILVLPPITIVLEPWKEPLPFFHPEQLALVFELQAIWQIRSTMTYSCTNASTCCMRQYSNAPAGQKCPTCARSFVLQTRNGPHNDDPNDATSDANG
jgi:hypothetical protein